MAAAVTREAIDTDASIKIPPKKMGKKSSA
jgi:hypothetical protein